MNDRLKVALDEVAEVVSVWRRAERDVASATAEGAAAVIHAEAGLRKALGGISLARWEALMTGKASLRTARVARELHQVARSRKRVEEALRALAAARSGRDTDVREAEEILAEAGYRLARYGLLAERVAGLRIEELCRTGRV